MCLHSEQLHRFLDLGSWDGTCSRLLHDMGKFSVGVDIRTEGYTAEARQSGASFIQLDADTLSLADNSFDFVFSFNSFEHFPHPDTALREAIRVTRPNGYLYLDFGPCGGHPKGHISLSMWVSPLANASSPVTCCTNWRPKQGAP
jgi:ubiquinone/menaquinone biosynthesis C-methylase UbiE